MWVECSSSITAMINTPSLSFSLISTCYFQGSVSVVSHIHSFVLAIYDCIVVTSPKDCPPTLLRIFRGQSFGVRQLTVEEDNYWLVDSPLILLTRLHCFSHYLLVQDNAYPCSSPPINSSEFRDWMSLLLWGLCYVSLCFNK